LEEKKAKLLQLKSVREEINEAYKNKEISKKEKQE